MEQTGEGGEHAAPVTRLLVVNGTLAARWRDLESFVIVNNVLNNRYETFGTFAPDGRVPGSPVVRFLTPAPPINVVAGLRYTF